MRSVIMGGLWAFVLCGTAVVLVAIWAGPPALPPASQPLAASPAAAPAPEVAQTPEAAPIPQTPPAVAATPAPEPAPEAEAAPVVQDAPVAKDAPAAAPAADRSEPAAPAVAPDLPDTGQVAPPASTDTPAPRTAPAPAAPAVIGTATPAAPAITAAPIPVNRPAPPAPPETPEVDPQPRGGALAEFAIEFSRPEQGGALLGIVLRDDPALIDAPAQIAALPVPVSVVLDLTSADVSERMRAYRAAGLEVMVTTPLPQGASPADVSVTYELARAQVPQAVAVFVTGAGADGVDPVASDSLMGLLAADGRGLVLVQAGLGTALRQAETAGVAAVAASHDLTRGDGQRLLDQAAFRARQTGQNVLAGSIDPQTLDLLRNWDAQGQVTIVPVSLLLLGR